MKHIKNIFINMTQKEEIFYDNATFFLKNKLKEINIFLAVIMTLFFSRDIPYVNIILNQYHSLVIIVVLFHLLFWVSTKFVLILTLSLYALSFIYLIRGNTTGYEQIGNSIYFLLWYICVFDIIQIWKKQIKSSQN